MRISGVLLSVVLVVLLMSGCGKPKEDPFSLSDAISLYQEQGIEVDASEKPTFQAIGASDGVIFYIDEAKVSLYEFNDDKALDQASKLDFVSGSKGNVVLETKNQKAIEIFNSTK